MNNITPSIEAKCNRGLHNQANHPLCLIKTRIQNYFGEGFTRFDYLKPVVTIFDNFDALRITPDHPARKPSDTYYVDAENVLRTHISAHQHRLLKSTLIHPEMQGFLVTGDVYRKDAIDATHFPVFHQMEGVKLFDKDATLDVLTELKATLGGLITEVFPGCEYRFSSDYFPFTDPSIEAEVNFNGQWLEVLGAGVIHPEVLEMAGITNKTGWAFGLGLERLAMILYGIPDVRLFWSDDPRFLNQFGEDKENRFVPFSNQPPVTRDIAFWIGEQFTENDFCGIVRECGEDLVENVTLMDTFTNPKTNRTSNMYRIVYRSHERSLTNEEINEIQEEVRQRVANDLGVELR
jgi:phenylalanyl-tRNA synthetase alpha chain